MISLVFLAISWQPDSPSAAPSVFFGKSSVSHLGFKYSNDGVSPTAEKTK